MTSLPFITVATILQKVKTSFIINEDAIEGDKPTDLNIGKDHALVDTDGNYYGIVSQEDVDKLLGLDDIYNEAGFNPHLDCIRQTIWLDPQTFAHALVNVNNTAALVEKANRFAVTAKPIADLSIVPICMIGYAEEHLALALSNLVGGFDHERAVCGVKLWHLTPSASDRLNTVRSTMITLIDKDTGQGLRYQIVPVLAMSGPPIQWMVIYNQNIETGVLLADFYEAIQFAHGLKNVKPLGSKSVDRSKGMKQGKRMTPSFPITEKTGKTDSKKADIDEDDDDDDDDDYDE